MGVGDLSVLCKRGARQPVLRWLTLIFAMWVLCTIVAPALADDDPESWTNVLLLGVDKMAYDLIRSDSIMVLSVSDKGHIKLTSFLRDMVVDIEGYGPKNLNRAYSYGGASLAASIISQYFQVRIDGYAVVNFAGLTEIVDALGGIHISITQAEMVEINETLRKKDKLSTYGNNTLLNGRQALRFARIRTIDSDTMRTSRQRQVFEAIVAEIKSNLSIRRMFLLCRAWARHGQTDLPLASIARLGTRIYCSETEIEQYRIPVDGSFECEYPDGVLQIFPDYQLNAALLREFLLDD